MNTAERLSEYTESISYSDLREDITLEAKKRIIDSLGCAIGAFGEAPVKIARKVAESNHLGGSSTILGLETKTSPDLATFVNGLMVRYFDYNDTYLSKEPAHPSDNISACLAVGEREGSSGKDLHRNRARLRGAVQALRRRGHQTQGVGPRLLRAGLERPRRREDHGTSPAEAHPFGQHIA